MANIYMEYFEKRVLGPELDLYHLQSTPGLGMWMMS